MVSASVAVASAFLDCLDATLNAASSVAPPPLASFRRHCRLPMRCIWDRCQCLMRLLHLPPPHAHWLATSASFGHAAASYAFRAVVCSASRVLRPSLALAPPPLLSSRLLPSVPGSGAGTTSAEASDSFRTASAACDVVRRAACLASRCSRCQPPASPRSHRCPAAYASACAYT